MYKKFLNRQNSTQKSWKNDGISIFRKKSGMTKLNLTTNFQSESKIWQILHISCAAKNYKSV